MNTILRWIRGGLMALPFVMGAGSAWGDCGSIPFEPTFNPIDFTTDASKPPKVDPVQVRVYEPLQRGLILWNGEEEILLLSTDQSGSQPSHVLEVIPFPNEPKVKLGEFETFEKCERLFVDKHMWVMTHPGAEKQVEAMRRKAARVTFRQKMGAHDLTVLQVLEGERFAKEVGSFLEKRYNVTDLEIRPEFLRMIDAYIKDGMDWFVFDVIELSDEKQSRQPVEYRFKSDEVFYPMRISTLELGETEVDLTVFSAKMLSNYEGLPVSRFNPMPVKTVSQGEIADVNMEWAGFFGAEQPVNLNRWRLRGDIAKFDRDIRVK